MKVTRTINSILKKLGIEIKRYPTGDLSRRVKLLNNYKIDLIIDIGANKGEYTSELINLGYTGRIESFEPVSEVYHELNAISKKHKIWNTHKIALGDFDGQTEINIAGNINSSSLLEMLPRHEKSAPSSKYTKKENIHVRQLDSIINSLVKDNQNIFIKIDVQGYENVVLKGAEKTMDRIKGIQIEMSLEPLYQGSMLYKEMIDFLESKGFELHSIENGFSDPKTGKLLQCDGIFFRS